MCFNLFRTAAAARTTSAGWQRVPRMLNAASRVVDGMRQKRKKAGWHSACLRLAWLFSVQIAHFSVFGGFVASCLQPLSHYLSFCVFLRKCGCAAEEEYLSVSLSIPCDACS
jgi:hypothetical protein